MAVKVDDVIVELIKDLNKKFDDLSGIYLYGTFLDGKMHEDEDIELVAIFEKEDKQKREIIWQIVGKIESDLDVFIDLHPLTEEAFKKDEEFFQEVIETGIYYDKNKVV